MSIASTFQAYLSSLELTDRERADASAQQVALRDRLRLHLAGFVDSRLVGSYRRGTAIRPLKDIDVFVVLDAREHRRDVPDAPLRLLQAIERALRASYPNHKPRIQGRSVNIGFSGTEIDYDIVAAFAPTWTGAAGTEPPYYEIPDRRVSTWIYTNPAKHVAACIAANERAGGMLNGLIKAAKHWNRTNGKPLSGFHIEVMSYSAFWSKPDNPRAGLRDLFQHLANAVQSTCPDPAGLGPAIDTDLTSQERTHARNLLQGAAQVAQVAVDAERKGDHDTAIARWRSLLGDVFR
ncbi:MAG TPA: CBASS oligonucleotide cyclase [Kofleriaceae bacterium]|nr:CBASS oligonucleotide cyclase [Kofleriaceae bacterium]